MSDGAGNPDHLSLRRALRWHGLSRTLLIGAGLVLLITAGVVSVGIGVNGTNPGRTAWALPVPALPDAPTADLWATQKTVIYHLRLPRILMAIAGGAGLAMAGVAMQGITRNPLVSPYTVGISPAAAFGASVAIVLGLGLDPVLGLYWTVIGAFVSAMACASLVLLLASLRGVTSSMLILGGVGLTYLFSALTAIQRPVVAVSWA